MTSLFDPLVEYYDAARPSYPDALFDALAGLTQPLRGARVVEVGAGTGIATRALRSRGATVLCQRARIDRDNPGWEHGQRHHRPWVAEFTALDWSAQAATCSWTRTLDVDAYLVWMRSKSYVAAIGGDRLEAFPAEERQSLLEAFPRGIVQEPFVTELYVVRPPSTAAPGGN